MNNWMENLRELKEMHLQIAELCIGKKLAYVDIPFHGNVGDHLIYMGTEAFFEQHQLNVIYRAFDTNVCDKNLDAADVIVCHGGGNLGDIYHIHQALRDRIIEKYPNKKIIVMPQTIHFNSQHNVDACAKKWSQHKDLHLFVRDTNSLEIGKQFTPNCTLMPDMAHSLHPLVDVSEVLSADVTLNELRILNLRRVDVEKVQQQTTINKQPFDWVDLTTTQDIATTNLVGRIRNKPFLKQKSNQIWFKHSKSLCFRAVQHFMSHNVVYTDRLHGMILSYLLGRRIKLMDNSYGKNLNYFNQWIKQSDLVEVLPQKSD
ncbi:polysaccharide pyruvyl transferase family protein [Vibrio hippocampi]|uniref:Pyruvyl transferase EpsO n=1 Tax=Vibrio hippocampi TaxID=654686 RepID=A0ABM8ZLS8_9VIBR|nr:polysaccharide pyruvyl transferase family protein [Vibrio hippocampi]CAH0529076.1 Putative pyruvyl transferase EpsO [Vibrio hippocampi]